jgi:ubiquinone/menaquinone biosynthesis C-methylase UbiE
MTITAADFWDQIAPKYSQQAIADPETYATKLAITQQYMEPHMAVLEFGCGTGSTALKHAPLVSKILATDVSEAMLDFGRDKAAAAGINNVEFKRSGIEDFVGENESYDLVLALNLLHLVADREKALKNIHQLLKPGGVFISSTACLSDRMWYIQPIIPIMQWFGKAPFVNFLRAKRMRAEIIGAGFEDTEHWTHGRANSLFMVAKKR